MGLNAIFTGWGKKLGWLPTSDAEKALSDLRLRSCIDCPFAAPKQVLVFLNGNATYEDTLLCTKCTCPCLEKSLVVSETCPIKKW